MVFFYLLWVWFSFFIWIFCDLKWAILERKIENFFVVVCFLSFFYMNIWVFLMIMMWFWDVICIVFSF